MDPNSTVQAASGVQYDRRADHAQPGFYWVRVMGADPVGWQVAECSFRGWWSLRGMPRYGTSSYSDMIREVGERLISPAEGGKL